MGLGIDNNKQSAITFFKAAKAADRDNDGTLDKKEAKLAGLKFAEFDKFAGGKGSRYININTLADKAASEADNQILENQELIEKLKQQNENLKKDLDSINNYEHRY